MLIDDWDIISSFVADNADGLNNGNGPLYENDNQLQWLNGIE